MGKSSYTIAMVFFPSYDISRNYVTLKFVNVNQSPHGTRPRTCLCVSPASIPYPLALCIINNDGVNIIDATECLSCPMELFQLLMRWVTSIEIVALPFPGAFRQVSRIDRLELSKYSSYGRFQHRNAGVCFGS